MMLAFTHQRWRQYNPRDSEEIRARARALLEVFTPVSMVGLEIGCSCPPHHVVHFGVGGLIKLITDRS